MTTAWRYADVPRAFDHALAQRGYVAWTRIMDDDVVFILAKHNEKPGANDGGYRWLDTACKMKGVRL